MRNIKLVLEYDGTNYHGWQTQPNLPTIQETVEKSLTKLTKSQIQIIGAGRTDSGVHAEGQVANFYTDSDIPLVAFQKGLNAILPRDIVVCAADRGARRISRPLQCHKPALPIHDIKSGIPRRTFPTDKLPLREGN